MINPLDSNPEFVLKVGGDKFTGWLEVMVDRSLEQFAHQFSVTYVDVWTLDDEPWQIFAGDECELLYGDQVLVTGYITQTDHDITGSDYRLDASGRSNTADLVDCSAVFEKGIWRNKTLLDIVEAVCEPFNIEVEDRANATRVFKRFEIDEGETAHDLINRACSIRAVLPITSSDGKLILMRSDSNEPAGAGLISILASPTMDMNAIISRRLTHSEQDRFSEYIFKGQTKADDEFFSYNVVSKKGSAQDLSIERYRPLVLMGESASSKEDLGERAIWERSARAARSDRLSYTLDGLTDADGNVWQPGQIVKVKDKVLKVNAELLVIAVRNRLSLGGLETELELSSAEAFSMLELPERGNAWNA